MTHREVQLSFPPRVSGANRQIKLLSLDATEAVLRMDTEGVLELVETGALMWVFDFARAGARCRSLLFWHVEVAAVAAGKSGEAWRLQEVLDEILPTQRPAVLSTECDRLFQISETQVRELVNSGEWPLESPFEAGRGPNSARRVSVAGLREWLRGRLVD